MQAHRLPAQRGWFWIAEGYRLYRRNPRLLTSLTLAYFILVLMINVLPIIGPFLSPFVLPFLNMVVANGCRALDTGTLQVEALQVGLRENRRTLLRLGALQLLGGVLVLVMFVILNGGDMSAMQAKDKMDEAMLASMAKLALMSLPLGLAFWFAPFLVAWHNTPALKALFFSFVAVWRNWRAFLIYGLSAFFVGLVAPSFIMAILGLIAPTLANILKIVLLMMVVFMLLPVMMASFYISYRDVFERGGEGDVAEAAARIVEGEGEAGAEGKVEAEAARAEDRSSPK